MTDNEGRSSFSLPYTYDALGGRLYGYTDGGEMRLAFTSCGEFGAEILDNGELAVGLFDHGLALVYSQEGRLQRAAVDVGDFVSGMSKNRIEKLRGRFPEVYAIRDFLQDNGLTLLMSVDIARRVFDIGVKDNKTGEWIFNEQKEDVRFESGLVGSMNVSSMELTLLVDKKGDELMLGVGEINGTDLPVMSADLSMFLDFESDLFADDGKGMQRLAKRIILG